MKTATYRLTNGKDLVVEYDETAPCQICGEPVVEASTSGTVICPWCDTGHCRYCGIRMIVMGEHIDGGSSLRACRHHMNWHREHTKG